VLFWRRWVLQHSRNRARRASISREGQPKSFGEKCAVANTETGANAESPPIDIATIDIGDGQKMAKPGIQQATVYTCA
jgi:hypothetical protein